MAPIPTFEQHQESQRQGKLYAGPHVNQEPGFIVRVELHGIEKSQDYQALREHMIAQGFMGNINTQNAWFKLPTATYYLPNPTKLRSAWHVYNKAFSAVQAALKNEYAHVKAKNEPPTILVTETQHVYWTGLELADD